MTPRTQRLIGFVAFGAFAVFVLVLPQFISDFKARDYAYVGIYLIALLGLNILTGYTGQISLGHGAFMAIGGYTTAILMAGNEQFGGPVSGGVQDVWTLPIAGLVAGLVGLAFGLPALRLSGLYLALATFAIAVAMPSTVKRFEEYTGGGQGIQLFGLPELTGSNAAVGTDLNAPATFEVLGLTFTQNDWMYYLAWSIALAGFAGAWLVLRGRTGRAFRAVRDSETAAVSSGVSLARYKTLAFGISAAYAGVAGGLFAIASAFVNPDTFPIALSIFLLVGIVVGGLGGLSGLVVGAIFVAFLPLWAQGQDLGSLLPDSVIQGDQVSIPILGDFLFKGTSAPGGPAIVYGIVLILLMFVLPNGVGGLFRRMGQAITSRRYARSKPS
jgi:branched-chain amino acid transport system permease protein